MPKSKIEEAEQLEREASQASCNASNFKSKYFTLKDGSRELAIYESGKVHITHGKFQENFGLTLTQKEFHKIMAWYNSINGAENEDQKRLETILEELSGIDWDSISRYTKEKFRDIEKIARGYDR